MQESAFCWDLHELNDFVECITVVRCKLTFMGIVLRKSGPYCVASLSLVGRWRTQILSLEEHSCSVCFVMECQRCSAWHFALPSPYKQTSTWFTLDTKAVSLEVKPSCLRLTLPPVVTEVFRGVLQSLHTVPGQYLGTMPSPFPSAFLPIHYSLIDAK